MFKELLPVLRDRAVLLTVTLVDADQIRVNIVPKKLKDGDNDALTTPLSVTGTAEDLDAELSSTIISFVGSHLQMKNTNHQLRRLPSSDEEHTGEGEGRDGCGIQSGSGRGAREVQSAYQGDACEGGSHAECSRSQACRANEARTAEARKPLRYADTSDYSHNYASRTGR
jgi:PRTRC genetic system protein E